MKFARSGCLGVISVCVLIVIVVALLPDAKSTSAQSLLPPVPTPHSDSVQFDPQENAHKAQLDQMDAGAGACMERAIHGLLMQGVRNKSQLLNFAESTCGPPLKKFLISIGSPPKAADAWVQKDAEDVLEVELR